MRLASIVLLLLVASVTCAAPLTYQQEIIRALEKYGTPEKVPADSLDYLAKFGQTSKEEVEAHLKQEYSAAQYAAQYGVPYAPGGGYGYGYGAYGSYGSPYGAYPYSINGGYPYPANGFDPHVRSIYERRYRQYWKNEYLNDEGPQRPSRDYWPPRAALKGEEQRAEAWAKKAWREAYGTWWGYPWDQRSNYLWSDRESRRYQRSIEQARHEADRAYRSAYEKEMQARVQAGHYWNGAPWISRASTEYPRSVTPYNMGYNPYYLANPYAYGSAAPYRFDNSYRYGYQWNPPPTDRNFNTPLSRWFDARMRGDVK